MKQTTNSSVIYLIILVLLVATGCDGDYVPKPKGYLRFDLPEHNYRTYNDSCPYSFEIGKYAEIERRDKTERCWKNIYVKPCKGRVHLSYKAIDSNLKTLLEDAHELVYSHTVKADAIKEQRFMNPKRDVYGVLYEIKGDAASNIQFIATDSATHFLRGALYFRAAPNEDSLAPLIRFMRRDIEHLIETLHWK